MHQVFGYVMSPYSDPSPVKRAFRTRLAAWAIGQLMQREENLSTIFFSPVVHYHQVAARSLTLPRNVHYWWSINLFYMQCATHAVVLQMPGWEQSTGIAMALAWFKENSKAEVTYYNLPWEKF